MIAMFKLAMTNMFSMFSLLFSAGARGASALNHGAGWADASMETIATVAIIDREISVMEALGKAQMRANKLGLDVDVMSMLEAAKTKVVEEDALPDNILKGVTKKRSVVKSVA